MTSPRKIELLRVPDPGRGEGDILVRMTRVTICGSDLHEFRGRTPRSYPWSTGKPAHECLGRILESGQTSGFSEGDVVLVRPPDGGLMEIVSVDPSDIIPVGYGLDLDLAVMAQLLAPVIHCCKRLGNLMGRSVFILGQGPAGLTLTEMVRSMGAGSVDTCDLVEGRLQESKLRGADQVFLGGQDLLERAGDRYDLVIEAVGDQETISQAPQLAREKGSIMFFGLPGERAILRPREFFGKQLHITTTEFPEGDDFRHALKLMADGQIDMGSMVTHRLPFDQVQRGYDLADSRAEGVLRVVLDMES